VRAYLLAVVVLLLFGCTLPHEATRPVPASRIDTVYIRESRIIEKVSTAVLWGIVGYATATLVAR
jgi:outer membrane biogenesis lipoprotein LolB